MENELNKNEYQYDNREENVNFVMYNPEPEMKEETTEEKQKSEQASANNQHTSENVTYSYSYVNPTPPVKQKKKRKLSKGGKKWILCVSMAIVFGLVASAVFQTSNLIVQKMTGTEEVPNKSVSTTVTKENASDKELADVAAVASNVMPSVVSITNLSVQEVQSWFGGITTQEYESTGSGIIVGQNDVELLIVSNNHVVEGSKTLTVSFVDENSVEAIIKGTDANLDLAIIAVPLNKISAETLDAIKIATLGDSNTLSVGEPAIAIGNALGY